MPNADLWWFKSDMVGGDKHYALCVRGPADQQTRIFIRSSPRAYARSYVEHKYTLLGSGMLPGGKGAAVLGTYSKLSEAKAAAKTLYLESPETYR